MQFVYPQSDGVIAISSYLQTYFESRGCNSIVIPPLVDVLDDKWITNPKANGDVLSLVYAGSPGRKDLLDRVLLAMDALSKDCRVQLNVIGPEEADIRRLAATVGLSPAIVGKSVVCHGRLSHRDALQAVGGADFSIFARHDARYANAGFPTKFVESLMLGVPVICNRTSDIPMYARDGAEAIFAENESVGAIAQALKRAASMSYGKRSAMRASARQCAIKSFDFRVYSDALRQLVECNRSAARTAPDRAIA
jgi:glycosyltransferase involved in cell wall biosynthesis